MILLDYINYDSIFLKKVSRKVSARSRSGGSGEDPLQLTESNIAMKPVQNLDSLNPATGLPNIGVLLCLLLFLPTFFLWTEFVPTTEYGIQHQTTSILPDWTPSPDTTAR